MLATLFHTHPSQVLAVKKWLNLLQVKINVQTINDTLQNHPDWPSLLSVSDALQQWNTPNAAGRMEAKDPECLPTPFLAHTLDAESPLAVVAAVTETYVKFYTGNYKKPQTKSKEDFHLYWTGVYLIAEPQPDSGEPQYRQQRNRYLLQQLLPVALLVAILLTGIGVFQQQFNGYPLVPVAQGLLYTAGVLVSSLLLWYEMDRNNPLLHKVCTGIAKGNCNAILTGPAAKVFSWLSWSEVGFFYFTGGLLLLLNAPQPQNLLLLGWLNLFALPYTLFSVYYQWRVAKQWCVLCLAVQALLVIGAVLFVANYNLAEFGGLTGSLWVTSAFCYGLPVLGWYVSKPYLLHLQQANATKRSYRRLKFNGEIFETLLHKQPQVNVPANGLGITLGNPQAKHTLIKVCNPYCGPCSKAHPKVEALLKERNNLKVQVIFIAPNMPEHKLYAPVNHLLAVQETAADEQTLHRALDDWYLAEEKDYRAFASKYPVNGALQRQGHKIEAMDKWCRQMNIAATPTFFINGYQLPEVYDVTDLNYFLQE